MSTSPDLTLAIKLDDVQLDKAIKKLQSAVKLIEIQLGGAGIGKGGGTGSSSEKSRDPTRPKNYWTESLNKFKGMGDRLKDISKSTLSLIGIGTGIGALVAMMTDAAPMLQAIMKMVSVSIMLILRPIGDFIGFILRPIILAFMTTIALPFMKAMMPLVKKYGDKIGQFLVDFLKDPAAGLQKLVDYGIPLMGQMLNEILGNFEIQKIANLIGSVISGLINAVIIAPILNAWKDIRTWLDSYIFAPLQDAWDETVKFFEFLGASVSGTLQNAWRVLIDWGNAVWAGVNNVLFDAWNILVTWWAAIQSGIGVLTQSWEVFTKFFSIIASDAGGWVHQRWITVTQFFSNIASDATGWLKDLWDDITGFFQAISNALSSIWAIIQAWTGGGGGGGGGGRSTTPTQQRNPWGRQIGGIISEPILGMGLRSGHAYSFGESGPEMVTPLSKNVGRGAGGGIKLYVTVGTIMNPTDMDMFIQKIMSALQKEQYRRGLV